MPQDYSQCGKQAPTDTPIDLTRNLWNTRFLNVPAIQFWADFMLWENVLTVYPVKGLIELGSAYGGLSLFFQLQCIQRGMQFATFDWQRCGVLDTPVGQLSGIARNFYHCDLWREGGDKVRELLSTWPHPLALLCDNGNKPREFATFAPLLTPGDIVACHDWGNEMGYGDIEPLKSMVKEVFADECEQMGSLTRFFQRV